jgi:hypothetical protein
MRARLLFQALEKLRVQAPPAFQTLEKIVPEVGTFGILVA